MRLKLALVLGIFGVATACGKSDEGGNLVNQTSAVAGARRDVGGAQSGAIPSPARAEGTEKSQSETIPPHPAPHAPSPTTPNPEKDGDFINRLRARRPWTMSPPAPKKQ